MKKMIILFMALLLWLTPAVGSASGDPTYDYLFYLLEQPPVTTGADWIFHMDVIFDDPADQLTFVRVPAPQTLPDWSRLP